MPDPVATPGASPTPSATPSASQAGTPADSGTPSVVATPAIQGAAVPGQQATPASTEPPKERWEDILTNARKKTRSEVEAEFRQRYAPYDQFEQDPWSAVHGWLSQASQHSLYGPMVQQWAQQMLQANQPEQEPQADVPIVDANGNVTGYTFSDRQLKSWNSWSQTRQQRELESRLTPLEQRLAAIQEREQAAMAYQQANQQAGATLSELRKNPLFKEHEADVRQAFEDHEEWGDNVHAAWNHVLVTKILPNLGQAEQKAVLDSLSNKSTATTVAPNGTAPGRPSFKSFREAAEYFAVHPEEAKAMANRE